MTLYDTKVSYEIYLYIFRCLTRCVSKILPAEFSGRSHLRESGGIMYFACGVAMNQNNSLNNRSISILTSNQYYHRRIKQRIDFITKSNYKMESWSDQSFTSHSDQVEFSAKSFKEALKRVEDEYRWMKLGYYDDKMTIDYQMQRVEELDKENDELIANYNKDMARKGKEIKELNKEWKEHMKKIKEEFENEKRDMEAQFRQQTNILKEELRMQDMIISSMKKNEVKTKNKINEDYLKNPSGFMSEKKMEFCIVGGHIWALPKVGRRKIRARKAKKKVLKLNKLIQ